MDITVLINLAKDNPKLFAATLVYALLAFLISALLGHRSQVDAWAESNPRVAGVLKVLRGFGIDPWLILQGLSLFFRGKLPAVKAPAPKRPPTGGAGAALMLMMLALCALPSCGAHVNWPALLECTGQIRADLASAVAAILRQPGDPGPALDALAKQLGADGPSAIACAVQSFLDRVTAYPDGDEANSEAIIKGRNFLRARGVKVQP